jgi:protein TonB
VYPARALARGVEGYVDMSFTVTLTGTVENPVVLYSTNSLFDRSAIQAVLRFKYKPRVVDGVPVAVPNVKTRISFRIEE